MADGAPQAPLSSLGSFCWLSRLPACLTGRVPALTAGLRPAAGGWVWVMPTAFSPLPTRASFGVFMPRMGAAFWLPFFFLEGEDQGCGLPAPCAPFPPVAMQTQPLVIPAPSPHPPLLPPGPGFGVWDGDGFGLAVFSVLRVWVLGGTQRPEAFSWGCGHFWAALLPGAGSPLWCRMALG